MAETSSIEWTDATWNPITGCSVISPGCKHCYAMKLAGGRLRNHPSRAGLTIAPEKSERGSAGPVWTGEVRVNEAALLDPIRWKRPRRIFVCAHGDLFHESVLDSTIDRVFAVMALAPQHTFQVLTKRADRMRAYLTRPDVSVRVGIVALGLVLDAKARSARSRLGAGVLVKGSDINPGALSNWPLPNVWLGVSAETQYWLMQRAPHLLETPAAVRFVSHEPALGPLDVEPFVKPVSAWSTAWLNDYPLQYPTARIDWFIAGGESGPRARPMHPDWARSLRDQCAAWRVPFFFKQWGKWAPLRTALPVETGADGMVAWPDGRVGMKLRAEGPGVAMFCGTKAITGRLLDGVQHDGMPA